MNIDNKDKKILLLLQEGLPLVARPYAELAESAGVSEGEVISRAKRLKDAGLLKRIDFRVNLRKVGLVSTLVGCRVPDDKLSHAEDVIAGCDNTTHNYLRRHDLNMWFTLYAESVDRLRDILADLRRRLGVQSMLSFETRRVLKLRFRLYGK